jgi:hypothetical protein
MAQVRLATRNVFVYDGTNNAIIGGCRQFGTTSIAEFFFCIRLFVVTPVDFQLYHEEVDDYVTQNDQGNIQPGNYFLSSISKPLFGNLVDVFIAQPITYLTVTLTNEDVRPRKVWGGSPSSASVLLPLRSRLTYPQASTFRDRVRQRDRCCKVTGLDTSMFQYVGLNASHIIPRSHAQLVSSAIAFLML